MRQRLLLCRHVPDKDTKALRTLVGPATRKSGDWQVSPTLQTSPGRAPLFPPGSPGAGATRVTVPIMPDATRWPRRGGREGSGERGLRPSSQAWRGRDPAGGRARLPRGQHGCSPPPHGRKRSRAGDRTRAAAQPDPRQESRSPCCPSGAAGGPDQQGAALQGRASPVSQSWGPQRDALERSRRDQTPEMGRRLLQPH